MKRINKKYFIMTAVLCSFIFGFFMLESIYVQGKSYTVILDDELFTIDAVDSGDRLERLLEYKKTTFVFADSGEEFYYPQEVADANADDLRKYETFAGRKEMYRDMSFWKDKGTVEEESKTLKRLLCGSEKEGNTTVVYIDEATGLPVREEAFVNGKPFSVLSMLNGMKSCLTPVWKG